MTEQNNTAPALSVPEPVTVPRICRDVPFMTSLEIAALTGRRHLNVRQEIRRKLGDDASQYDALYLDRLSRAQPCYVLPGETLMEVIRTYRGPAHTQVVQYWDTLNTHTGKPIWRAIGRFFRSLFPMQRAA